MSESMFGKVYANKKAPIKKERRVIERMRLISKAEKKSYKRSHCSWSAVESSY